MDAQVEAALDALRAALESNPGRRPLVLQAILLDGGLIQEVVPPCDTDGVSGRQGPGLSEQIISLLQSVDKPLKGAAIARRLNKAYSGYFRETLRALIEEGEVEERAGHTYTAATDKEP